MTSSTEVRTKRAAPAELAKKRTQREPSIEAREHLPTGAEMG